jgi:hypothetical protein
VALKAGLAELKFDLALRRFARKYRDDQPRDDHGRWVYDGGRRQTGHLAIVMAGMPRIPQKRPPDSRDRTAIARAVANWIAENAVPAAEVIATTSWLYYALPTIVSYLDPPRDLDELQAAASSARSGYDRHHIVEQTSAEQDGYSRQRIDGPDNIISIPKMKHWEINAWYQRPNEDYQDMSPREYLRHKDWDERERVGLDALRRFKVLKP